MWGLRNAAMIKIASLEAAFEDIIPRVLAAADIHADKRTKESNKLTNRELRTAAVIGVDGARINRAKERKANGNRVSGSTAT